MDLWFIIFKGIKSLFLVIDRTIAWGIDQVYWLLTEIADTVIFGQDTIQKFSYRVGIVLGLFMLFKISVSMLGYIMNPDSLTDSNKGASKIILNVVIALSLLATYNMIFDQAYKLQELILKQNVLARIIFGVSDSDEKSSDYFDDVDANSGEDGGIKTSGISFYLYSAFLQPNQFLYYNEADPHDSSHMKIYQNVSENELKEQLNLYNDVCKNIYSLDHENRKPCVEAIDKNLGMSSGRWEGEHGWISDGKYAQYSASYCLKIGEDASCSIDTHGKLLDAAIELKSTELLLSEDLALLEWNYIWRTDYYILIPTAVGIAALLMLVGFCIDVGIRAVKLSFLQLIAPIPIISYIDFKGKDVFNKWVKQCANTFLGLFIRLLGLYFAIFLISEVAKNGIYRSNGITERGMWDNPFVTIFIILGALMFAKQLPKLIQNITGINIDGDGKFTLNPLKKAPILGGALAAGGVVAGSSIRNGFLRSKQLRDDLKAHAGQKGQVKRALRGLGGIAGSSTFGAFAGARGAYKSGQKGTMQGFRQGMGANKQNYLNRQRGISYADEFKERTRQTFGMPSQYEMGKNEVERMNMIEQANKAGNDALKLRSEAKKDIDNYLNTFSDIKAGFDAVAASRGDEGKRKKALLDLQRTISTKYHDDSTFRQQLDVLNGNLDARTREVKSAKFYDSNFNEISNLTDNLTFTNIPKLEDLDYLEQNEIIASSFVPDSYYDKATAYVSSLVNQNNREINYKQSQAVNNEEIAKQQRVQEVVNNKNKN